MRQNGQLDLLLMSQYHERVIKRVLSLSVAKTVPEAFKEWELVPSSRRESSEHCELCGHTGFRYSHKIQNKENFEQMLIGSDCYSNFWGPNAKIPVPAPVLDLGLD